ncbi:MAG TPA: lytic transglycosylase domain-containing protein [Terriglobia bacterium]|nr:lytic transglycosylase domain-containing protein [Terriglobia bacterium]
MGSCRQSSLALWVCLTALAWLLSPPQVVAAEGIAVVTNERGEKVYVNDAASAGAERQSALKGCRRESCTGGTSKAVNSQATTPDSNAAASPAPAAPTTFDDLIDKTAARHHVDPQLVEAVVRVESDGNPHAFSSKGAQGLMQLIPATAQRLGVQDPYDRRQNVEGGVSYLRYLLDRFGGDVSLALAGYNAGENSVVRSGGVPPFKETRAYVRRVNELYGAGAGTAESSEQAPASTPAAPAIYRYVDGQGVVHYTNE